MERSQTIRVLWNKSIGHPDIFSIENRIFHGVILISSFILLTNAVVGTVIGLGSPVLFTFGFVPVLWYIFYLSRYKHKNHISILIFGIVANADCAFSYFYGDGSRGINLLLLLAITFVLIVICPKRQLWIWIPMNTIILVGLLVAEFYHPEWFVPMYTSTASRLADLGQTFFMMIIFLTMITYYIKDNYYTEKRRSEQREMELVELNEAKNKLFSIVAHDLRAPLASVQNYLELLKQVYLSDAEKENIQNHLLNSTKHTSEMLTNILSWTKAQMNGVSINFMQIDLHRTLYNTLQVQYHIAREKNIELSYPGSSSLQLVADPDMLQLIVRNLVNNAIKFTPSGGNISISYELAGKNCRIIIRDNGIGIAREKQEGIFSLKSQSTFGTNNEKGVGLGLVLAKSYVELQNGKIWFESKNGTGTTFFLSFKAFNQEFSD